MTLVAFAVEGGAGFSTVIEKFTCSPGRAVSGLADLVMMGSTIANVVGVFSVAVLSPGGSGPLAPSSPIVSVLNSSDTDRGLSTVTAKFTVPLVPLGPPVTVPRL